MISGDLEYLMNSLPYLSFQNTTEIRQRVVALFYAYAGQSVEQISLVHILEDEAKKFLSTQDYILFCTIDLDTIYQTAIQQSGNQALAEFSKFTFDLKEKVCQLRKLRRAGNNKAVSDQPGMISLEGTPLEQEIQLLRYQWDKLEDLAMGHYANLEALILYKLKMMLLLRWWGFDALQGFEKFTQLAKDN